MSILAAEQRIMAVKSPEETKKQLEGKESDPESQLEILEDPKMAREYVFKFRHEDGRKKVWAGEFKNKILNFTEKAQVGALRANLCGALPVDALDSFTLDMNIKLSHLTISLIDRPKWARDLGELFDLDILDKLYQEVISHESTFHGRGENQKDSETQNGNDRGSASGVVESEA